MLKTRIWQSGVVAILCIASFVTWRNWKNANDRFATNEWLVNNMALKYREAAQSPEDVEHSKVTLRYYLDDTDNLSSLWISTARKQAFRERVAAVQGMAVQGMAELSAERYREQSWARRR